MSDNFRENKMFWKELEVGKRRNRGRWREYFKDLLNFRDDIGAELRYGGGGRE